MSNTLDFSPEFTEEDFTSRHQKVFFKYYNKIKGGRKMPARSDINPADIVKVLPHLILIEIVDNDFIVRLMGTKCANVLGESTGKSLKSNAGSTDAIRRFKWCAKNKRPYFHKKPLDKNNKHGSSSAVVMPLSENDEDVNMFVLIHHFY